MDSKCHKLTASFQRRKHQSDSRVPVCSYYEVTAMAAAESACRGSAMAAAESACRGSAMAAAESACRGSAMAAAESA